MTTPPPSPSKRRRVRPLPSPTPFLPEEQWFPAGRAGARAEIVEVAADPLLAPVATERIRVVRAGPEDGPTVVLVHGWGCGAWTFDPLLFDLAERGFRVLAPEWRGHGLGDRPVTPALYRAPSLVSHLAAILDALAVERCVLVGHSMGGGICGDLARREPTDPRIAGLVLLGSAAIAPLRGRALLRLVTPPQIDGVLPALVPYAPSFAVRWLLALMYGDGRPPTEAEVEQYRAPAQFPEYITLCRTMLHEFEWDPRPAAPVPALVIHGTADLLFDARVARAAVDRWPNAELRMVEGAGHLVHVAAASETAGWIAEFAERVWEPSPRPRLEGRGTER